MFPVLWWSSNCYCREARLSQARFHGKHLHDAAKVSTPGDNSRTYKKQENVLFCHRYDKLWWSLFAVYIYHIWWTVSNVLHFRIPVTDANPHDSQSQRAVFPHSVKWGNIRSSNIKINTFSDAFLCNEHGKWDLMWNVVSLSQEQWAKNCDHSKAFKTEALCMNSLRKKEHFVAYTVKLGAVLKCSGVIHTWVC